MEVQIRKGFSFGLASGIITTLGLIIGLHAGTHSKIVIISGILIIAVADALSDALGIHISEEAEGKHTHKQIWAATIATFLSKFIFALTFIAPIMLFDLFTAIIVSIIWGLSLITIFSFYLAKKQNIKPGFVVLEHLAIAVFVIIVTHFIGDWIAGFA